MKYIIWVKYNQIMCYKIIYLKNVREEVIQLSVIHQEIVENI